MNRRQLLKSLALLTGGVAVGSLLEKTRAVTSQDRLRVSEYFRLPTSVTVFKDGDYAVAVDNKGRVIAKSTDHANVIRSAIDALDSNGGKIFLRAGNYKIDPIKRDTNWYVRLIIKNKTALIGEGRGKTVLTFTDKGASVRVDGISFDSGDLYDIEIRDLTLDGSGIDWDVIGYGSAIRPCPPTNTVNNVLIENLEIKNWEKEWGISWGYTDSVGSNLTIKNIVGYNLGRGVVWKANQIYCYFEDIVGLNILGYAPTQEGHVLAIESGDYNVVNGVFGENVPYALVGLAGVQRTLVNNVLGSTQLWGIWLSDVQQVSINQARIRGLNASGTYGIYIRSDIRQVYNINLDNIWIEGCAYGIYAEGNSTYNIRSLSFKGKISSWFTDQVVGVYGRYLDECHILIDQFMWRGGYGYLLDLDYITDSIIEIATHHGSTDLNLGSNNSGLIIRAYAGDFKTINSGIATMPAGSTSITVPHGLTGTPSTIKVTPLGDPGDRWWIDNVTSTSFDIVVATAPTADIQFMWEAKV